MLITITNKTEPATDLGYLLHKHPDRIHQIDLAFGQATVFFPVANTDLCTACLFVDVDPLAVVGGRGSLGHVDAPYVNDRPYVGSSLLSSAITKVFGTALSGRCKERPDLVEAQLELTIKIPALNVKGGESLLRRLFEPLGYLVQIGDGHSDDGHSGSGPFTVELSAIKSIREVLSQLSLLIPVADGHVHQWVDETHVAKAIERSESWLPYHPDAPLIIRRAFKNQSSLVKKAQEYLPMQTMILGSTLNDMRFNAVAKALEELGSKRVVDLGCGYGELIARLGRSPQFTSLLGVDVSKRTLELATQRLCEGPLANQLGKRIQFKHGSLMYRDPAIQGFDAALLIEVIEHVDEDRLCTLERVVFGLGRYDAVIVTTPNREYNTILALNADQAMRHGDHRFEWTRAEFGAWVERIAQEYGFKAEIRGIGPASEQLGPPTQMVVFTRLGSLKESRTTAGGL